MDLHYKQEVTVGLLVVAALVLLFGGLTFLTGKSFGEKVMFGVRFENIAGLGIGDPVTISGVRVGRVSDVDLQGVGDVVVHMEVAASVRPKVDAQIAVRTLDAFGAMYVDYSPGQLDEALDDGQILVGTRDLAIMETAATVANQASDVLSGAGALLSERTADEIHETLAATRRAMNVIARLGSGPVVREAARALERLSSVAGRLDSTLGSPDLARSVAQLDEITDNVNEMVLDLGQATQALVRMMERMESDSGTFGRLLNDTTLYAEMVETARSLRTLLDDIRERPARYFHLRVF